MQKIKDIIFDHIEPEIYNGHNAIGVFIALSKHSTKLNASGFRRTFGMIQRYALDALVLSLCKLYERPNKRYPNSNFSIPTAIGLMREDASDISLPRHNYVPLEGFIQSEINHGFSVKSKDDIDGMSAQILNYFERKCPQTPARNGQKLDRIFDALKTLRDKRVAHDESVDLSPYNKTDMDGAQKLLAFAKTYVNVAGYGIFGHTGEKTVADAADFAPEKSDTWAEMSRIISLL